MVIGTRGSELALWQARHVQCRLREVCGIAAELKIIKTAGDRIQNVSFDKMEGKGFFTKEIEEALHSGECDLAVHSFKDLPTQLDDRFSLGAVLSRADRREMLILAPSAFDGTKPLELKENAVVGTSSVRRISQLLYHRPDLQINPLRGNVPTRVNKLRSGQYDAVLVAAAGVDRLELPLDEFVVRRLPESIIVPAPAQGAIAIEIRAGDNAIADTVSRIDEGDTRSIVAIEREILRRLEGGCQLPLGVVADSCGEGYRVQSFLGRRDEDGQRWMPPRRVIIAHANRDQLIDDIVEFLKCPSKTGSQGGQTGSVVWITRDEGTNESSPSIGSKRGIVYIPTFEVVQGPDAESLSRELGNGDHFDWVVFTSANAVTQLTEICPDLNERDIDVGVIGRKTAEVAARHGWSSMFISPQSDAEAFGRALIERFGGRGGRVLFPAAGGASGELQMVLQAGGFTVERRNVYETVPHPELLNAVQAAPAPGSVIYTSSRAARFLAHAWPHLSGSRSIAIGPSTAATLLELGASGVRESWERTIEDCIEIAGENFQ